jgi:DNA-binding SARP family transcriptional activator
MPTTAFTLQTLGGAGLRVSGADELSLGPGKPLAVVTYLALTPGRRATRETLLDLCWADVDPERGRAALRQVLFHLRRILGEAAIVGAEELILQASVTTDRDRFLEAIGRDALDEAVATYGGHFLPDFGVPGGVAFEHWADLERDRLQSLFGRSAELLTRRLLNESRWREARALAERARAFLPDRESHWRLVLECALSAGDALAATMEADAFERHLAEEGVAGEPASRALIAHARRPTEVPAADATPTPLRPELTGRGREFAAIVAAWEAGVRRGQARHLHITAPAGVGKSRLLEEVAARLRVLGGSVVMTAAAARDRDIPFAFLGDLAASLAALPGASGVAPGSAAVLVALNPTLSARFAATPDATTGEESLRRRIHALLDLVQAVGEERPVALLLDDGHWLDDDSGRVIEALCDRLTAMRCLIVTAARPSRRIAGEATHVLELAPLTVRETAELIGALGTLPIDAPWAVELPERLHRASRGVPLLLLQSLRLAMDANALALVEGRWHSPAPDDLATHLGAGEAMRRRVAAITPIESRLLLALAVVGAPASEFDLAADADCDPSEAGEGLGVLERLGLVHREANGWDVTHDEVTRCRLELATADERATIERRIGLRLVGAATDDPHHERRGCRHLVNAGDTVHVGEAFRAFARRSRQRGDRRSYEHLAVEVVGADAPPARRVALLQAIPWHWRVGLWSARRQRNTMALGATILLGSVGWSRWSEADAAARPRLWYALGDGTAVVATPDRAGWGELTQPISTRRGASDLEAAARGSRDLPPLIGVAPTLAAWNVDAGGARTIDVWVRDARGSRNLTPRDRDQVVNDISPDGRFLIVATNEHTPPSAGAYDVAVLDAESGAVRIVSTNPDHELRPVLSPDGTRIAYLRESLTHPVQLCVVPFDGLDAPVCRNPAGAFVSELVGWLNASEILVVLVSGTTRPLVRYDWDADRLTSVLGPMVLNAVLSPNREWVVASARVTGVPGVREWLVPLALPGPPRQVRGFGGTSVEGRWWEGTPSNQLMIHHIAFTDSSRMLHAGVTRLLSVQAVSPSGGVLPIRAPLRWQSSDTSIATVNAVGIVLAKRPGVVRITASLAGWRSADLDLRVAGIASRLVVDEQWTPAWRDRWLAFGDPPPVVATGPGGVRGLWNRGDGVYSNLAVLRRSFDPVDGLGLEAVISTPLTRETWIRASVSLVLGVDTVALRQSDPLGAPIGVEDHGNRHCGVTYPSGDGAFGRSSLNLSAATGLMMVLPDSLGVRADGAWWRLRLQIFPDGRCGFAINGVPIWRSLDPMPTNRPYWVRLGHQSAETRVLHGPLQVWQGVRTDVDWSLLPERAP